MKKIAQTDAIFDQVHKVNQTADADETMLRISIQRVWGFLEQHWNGSLLDSVETILNFARTFAFRQVKPLVQFVSKPYYVGAKLTQKEMRRLEQRFQRLRGLRKWCVLISPVPFAQPA